MRAICAILVVTLCVTVLLRLSHRSGLVTSTQPASATKPTPPSTHRVDFSDVETVDVCPLPLRWSLTIRPDGSAQIQYGSTFGDSAFLPKGTFDFNAVVAEVLRQQSEEPLPSGTSVGLKMKGNDSTYPLPLKDDTYFRQLIASVSDKWQQKGVRFDQLRHQFPIYSPPGGRDP